MNDKCWGCKHFEYDEIYYEDTKEEEQIVICHKENNCNEENCKDFEGR